MLHKLQNALTDDDCFQLKSIFSPVAVGIPLFHAFRDLCLLNSGEFRHYGMKDFNDGSGDHRCYISSFDCGLSWKLHTVNDPEELGAMTRSPWSKRFIALFRCSEEIGLLRGHRLFLPDHRKWIGDKTGIYCIISQEGPGGVPDKVVRVCDLDINGIPVDMIRQPMSLEKRKRWLCVAQMYGEGKAFPVVFRSDDDGDSWNYSVLDSVAPFEVKYPHKGLRWQNYSCEPTIAELSDGRLMLLSRTSQDYHYQYFSCDGGESWSAPEPSIFHGTNTMPTLLKLRDGRIVFFWCNTQPLPELDHDTQPELENFERMGIGEDVFTNRDACHVAISEDDGRSWKGFRELNLTPVRNDADFRTSGGSNSDKSTHQFQAFELPFGKIMVAAGQDEKCQRIIIFDPQWLYENSRCEDFSCGMQNLSTHVYTKSLSGCTRGKVGHCSWNRTNGAFLVPPPEIKSHREVLLISRIHDKRLFSETQGVTWNFPAWESGELEIIMQTPGAGIVINLTDHWFNPIDTTVSELSQFCFKVENLPVAKWSTIRIEWSLKKKIAYLLQDNQKRVECKLKCIPSCPISYVHLQSLAQKVDTKGTLIKSLLARQKQ